MKMKHLILIGLMISANLIIAQTDRFNREQRKSFLEADSYYVYGDFRTAYEYFAPLDSVDPDFHELHYKMAFCLFQLKKYQESIPYFEKGIPYDFEALYYLTEIYIRQVDFEKALVTLELYESYWDDLVSKHSRKDIAFYKYQIETAEELMSDPVNIKLNNVGPKINTAAHEYVPLIDGDESKMVFTTKRLSETNLYNADGLPFEDVYVSYKDKDGNWSEAKAIEGKINTPTNDACVGMSTDGQTLFIFRPNENVLAGDIYLSTQSDTGWTEPVLMDYRINNFTSAEIGATISMDEKIIYFSSDRDGGYGGFDIYRVVKLPNGEWSYPKNLGPSINTTKNEEAPFLDADGKTLYFSSQGHRNMGGYDIFKSVYDEEKGWSQPENLGYPINTTNDDVHYVIAANEKHAYYSTEKKDGFGGQDIYQIDYLERSVRQSIIRAEVLDGSNQPIEAEISLIDANTGDLVGVFTTNESDGKFIFLVNPDVEYDLLVEYGSDQEYVETVRYTVDDLLKPQFKSIKL